MKKLGIIFLLNLIFIFTSCSSPAFKNEKAKIRDIPFENYLNEIEEDGIKKAIYYSDTSDRIYYLFEDENTLSMKIQDSYYSKGILEYSRRKWENNHDYVDELDYSIKEEKIIYNKNNKELNVNNEKTSIELSKDSFIKYIEDKYQDKLATNDKIIYNIIQYTTIDSDYKVAFLSKDTNPNYILIEGEVSWYYLRKNEETYFNKLTNKITEAQTTNLNNFLYDICISTFAAPGNFKFIFFVSTDYKYIYPYFYMNYRDVLFYKANLMNDNND